MNGRRRVHVGLWGMGAGAIAVTVLEIVFRNDVTLWGTLCGLVVGGCLATVYSRRRRLRDVRSDSFEVDDAPESPRRAMWTSVAWLVVGPLMAFACALVSGEPVGTTYFMAVLSLGVFIGVAGFLVLLLTS